MAPLILLLGGGGSTAEDAKRMNENMHVHSS